MKKHIGMIITLGMSILMASTAFAGQAWVQNADGTWSCTGSDGAKLTNSWSDDGYWLDGSGVYVPGYRTTENLKAMNNGQTAVSSDINSDGTEESIRVSYGKPVSANFITSITLSVDDQTYTMPSDGDFEPVCYYGDINPDDGYGNLIVRSEGESDCGTMYVFACNDDGIFQIGSAIDSYPDLAMNGSGLFTYQDVANFKLTQPDASVDSPYAVRYTAKVNGKSMQNCSTEVGSYTYSGTFPEMTETFHPGYYGTAGEQGTVYDENGASIGSINAGETFAFTGESKEIKEQGAIYTLSYDKVIKQDGTVVYIDYSVIDKCVGYQGWS